MKKAFIFLVITALLITLCACAAGNETTTAAKGSEETEPKLTMKPEIETKEPQTQDPTQTEAPFITTEAPAANGAEFNIYSLKGPTTMGIVTLLEESKNGNTVNTYHSTICAAADEVTAAIVNGDADIALLPANAAAALYNKAGGFSVVAINTLGVLYLVENGDTVQSVEDLAGKTVCLTGKGTTPEYSLRYLLASYGIEDQVNLEFKSEAQEVVAALSEDMSMIGLLPQPFVIAAMMQNENLRIAVDLNSEWNTVSADSSLVTGVTVVRTEVLEKNPEAVKAFLKEAAEGVDQVNSDPEAAAKLIAELGIVNKDVIAAKAIPFCNLVCIDGAGMKDMLSGYLQTLFDQNPKAVGGSMPAEEFYYTGE